MKRVMGIMGLLLAAYICVTGVSIWCYGYIDERCFADAAIILGAATANGEVSPVYRERIEHGIGLYESGYVERLIFTGGVGEGNVMSDACAAMEYAVAQGVPRDVILIEEDSRITEENLAYAGKIMESNNLKDAIIVSDPLHMKRAMLMAADYGIEAYSSPTPSSMYRTWRTKLPFLAREEFFYIGYCVVRCFR